MGGDAGNPRLKPFQSPISSSDTDRRSSSGNVGSGSGNIAQFPEGSLVEVRTDEVDFRGVYFSATVISSSTEHTRKGGRTKSKTLYVEYHDLLAREDGSDRLREHVDISHVRPAPPLQEIVKGFEPDDLVDAFYKDGWWQGVVFRVLEGGERFVVTFQNPPDVLEFGLADLRAHWDWVNGSWVRPQKQSVAGVMFGVGRKVEVSFDREDHQDAWFPATICEDLGNGDFLVDHMDNKGQAIQVRVDSLHVRPCPPLLKDKNFVLLEKVDAFFYFCWWSGVITKELENCRYLVYFKEMKQDKEFNQTDLRPHMEWKDGKWFTSSQEASKPSDDRVHDRNTSGSSSTFMETASAAPVKNPVDGKSTRDGKILSSLTLMKGHLIPDNQKMSHVTPKRRQYLSDSGDTLFRPPKKLRGGSVVEEKQQDKQDEPPEEAVCCFLSPDSVVIETYVAQTAEDHSSLKSSWGEKSRKQRNVRAKQNAGGEIKSTSSSKKKSSTQMLLERVGLDAGGEGPNAARMNPEDYAQNEHAKEGMKFPVIIGLPCAEIGSPEVGISGVKRDHRANSKQIGTIVNDQEQQLNNSPFQEIEDDPQTETGNSSERRKRGRPKKKLVQSTRSPVPGNAQNGGVGSVGLKRKDDGLQKSPVEVVVTEVSVPDKGKIGVNEEELANDQNKKNERVRTTKRTASKVKGVIESVGQGDNSSVKRGRKRIRSEKSAAQGQYPFGASGGKMMELSRIVDTSRVGGVPSKEFDNEPLSKWIEDMHSPSVIDSSRLPPERNLEQSMVNAEKQRDSVVIDEGSVAQLESRMQASAPVDKDSMMPSEPQALPSVENTVGTVLDMDSEKQLGSAAQTSMVQREPLNLPFVKNKSLWKSIESTMDIFQKMPQKPHFQPLQQVNGSSSREGLAIGYMLAFASLVERTSRLQLYDPRSVVDDIMGTVAELERHGFDVSFVQDQVTKFLEAKDQEEKLIDEVNNLNNQISQHCHEKARIDEEMQEMKELIRKLQEKISAAESGKGKEDNEIASLQVRLKDTKEGIENLRRNFKADPSFS